MRFVSLLLAGVVVFSTRAARADEETVHLVNGNVYGGELVEKVPGDHVTIKLVTGEIRKFEWSEIAPSVATQIVVTQTATPPPPRPAHVRFESDTKGALLVRVDNVAVNAAGLRTLTTETETPVCYAPCTADVDANAHYYVQGAYISRSTSFAIRDGQSVLSVRAGSSNVSTTGGWFLAVGVLSTVTGAIAAATAFATDDAKNAGWNGWEYFGVASLIAGGAFIVLSLPFIVAGRTHVAMGDMDVARRRSIEWAPGGFRF